MMPFALSKRMSISFASEPKQMSRYPAGHDLNDPAARVERARWLEKHIGLRVK